MAESVDNQNAVVSARQYQAQMDVLQLRLNTDPLLLKLECFLRGTKLENVMNSDRKIVTVMVRNGIPKANENGIQSLLTWIHSVINSQVVSGNFPLTSKGYSDAYEMYIYDLRMNLGDYLLNNIYAFDIDESELMGIIDFIMNLAIPYLSRLIDNKERESYGNWNTEKTSAASYSKKKGWFGENREAGQL